MGQVPALDACPFGIVGNGRVARHFRHDFNLRDLPVCAWARRPEAPSPPAALALCQTVLFLFPDQANVPFIDATTDATGALPGPLSRGDTDTITSNPQTLDGDPFQAAYAACVRAYEQRA